MFTIISWNLLSSLCSGNSENQSEINIRKGGVACLKGGVACFEDTCAVQNSENRSDITFEGGRGIECKATSNLLNNAD